MEVTVLGCKKRIFCLNFWFILHKPSSEARMIKRQETDQGKGLGRGGGTMGRDTRVDEKENNENEKEIHSAS